MKIKKLSLVSAVIFVLAVTACAPRKEFLKLEFRKGEKITYSGTTKTRIEGLGLLQSESFENVREFTYTQEVIGIDKAGIALVEIRFLRLAISQNLPGLANVKYDSDKDSENANPAFKPLKILINNPFILHFDNQGRVVKVRGFDKIIDKLLDSMDNKETEKSMRTLIQKSFSDEMISQIFSNTSPIIPAKAINIGESWESESRLSLVFFPEIRIKYQNTYASKEKGIAKIISKGVMYSEEGKNESNGDSLLPMIFKNGELEGQIYLNVRKGVVERFEMTHNIRMAIKMELGQLGSKGGQKIITHTEVTHVK